MAGASWGGSEELWVQAAAHALEKGHHVVVSVYDWGGLHPKLKQLQEKGAEISLRKRIYYGGSAAQRIKGFFVKKVFSANEVLALKKHRPDAIIISQGTIYECMFPEFNILAETTAAKLVVITQANSEYETIPSACFDYGRKLFGSAFQLYFVSKRNLEVAERQLAMTLKNATVVSNPANLESYEIGKWNEPAMISFAFVGRLNSTVKGLGVLLQILGQPQWQERSWQLNLYGRGEDEAYLKELVKLYRLEKKVSFRGFVNDIKQVWEANHVLLMPSTLEGTPLSLIEAMLSGRTAVVSDVGGNTELIEEGANGFVAEAPSVHSFGKAMERMWMRRGELQEFGKAANRSITANVRFDAHEQIIQALEKK
jgi:glycosyltransferase involved in cell wall biosynthesis